MFIHQNQTGVWKKQGEERNERVMAIDVDRQRSWDSRGTRDIRYGKENIKYEKERITQ